MKRKIAIMLVAGVVLVVFMFAMSPGVAVGEPKAVAKQPPKAIAKQSPKAIAKQPPKAIAKQP